jgi:hypothetical protein
MNLRLLAYYQIIGGVTGLLFSFIELFKMRPIFNINLLIFLVIFLLFTYSIFCGFLILSGKIKSGLDNSLVNQLIQLINFSLFGLTFRYASGIILAIGIDHTNEFLFTFRLYLSEVELMINKDPHVIKLGFNIIAFLLTLNILKLRNIFKLNSTGLKT